jgi:hypothetical protein
MPFADADRARQYQAEYRRLRRAGDGCTTPRTTLAIPPDVRIKTAADVLELLQEQVAAVRADPEAGTTERARTIGYLAAICLRAVEARDMTTRIEALEAVLKPRNGQAGR